MLEEESFKDEERSEKHDTKKQLHGKEVKAHIQLILKERTRLYCTLYCDVVRCDEDL